MKWWIGYVECGICEHVQRSKIEIEDEHQEPIVPLECKECGSMASVPVYDPQKDSD